MNKDLILDAMEFIDDELLEDVNTLRSGSPKRSRIWMRYASAAACVCIVLGGMIFLSRFGLYDGHEESDGMSNENMTENAGFVNETGAASDETNAVSDETQIQDSDSGHLEHGIGSCPDSLDYSDLDVSAVKTIRLTCGYTGETVWVTDLDDIKEITDCVLQIKCDTPESSRGYYGWSYGIFLYDKENPSDDTRPLWYGSMFWGKMYSEYTYETVKGHSYSALYRMTGITTEEIDSVCEKYFPSLENFD